MVLFNHRKSCKNVLSKKRNYSVSFSTEIYPSEAAKDVQRRLQMASGRSALGQDSSRAPPQAGAGRGSKAPVPLRLGWLSQKASAGNSHIGHSSAGKVSKQQPPDG